METEGVTSDPGQPSDQKFWYSVWGLPPADVSERVKKLMSGLRSHYDGPDFEPHVTVVGAISLTEDDAVNKFQSAVDGVKAYTAKVDRISTGTFYYQCVFLLLQPSPEVVEASSHCSGHFGYKNNVREFKSFNLFRAQISSKNMHLYYFAYMPHMNLLYADLSDEERKAAQEKANALDESISGLSFPITRLALYKTDTGDKSTKSWEKIAECNLIAG